MINLLQIYKKEIRNKSAIVNKFMFAFILKA